MRARAAGARAGRDVRPRRPDADWRASDDRGRRAAGSRFDVSSGASRSGAFDSPLYGAHNVRNALAAIAVGHAAGPVGAGAAARARARSAACGGGWSCGATVRGVSVYDDFAHHPTAILETLRAVRLVVSRPARVGRLRAPVGDVVPARLPARLRPRLRRVGRRRGRPGGRLPQHAARRRAAVDVERARRRRLRGRAPRAAHPARRRHRAHGGRARRATGDLVVVMSNGGFDGIHDKLLQALSVAGDAASEFAARWARRLGPERWRARCPLAPLTTFHVGGPADWLADVRSRRRTRRRWSHERGRRRRAGHAARRRVERARRRSRASAASSCGCA